MTGKMASFRRRSRRRRRPALPLASRPLPLPRKAGEGAWASGGDRPDGGRGRSFILPAREEVACSQAVRRGRATTAPRKRSRHRLDCDCHDLTEDGIEIGRQRGGRIKAAALPAPPYSALTRRRSTRSRAGRSPRAWDSPLRRSESTSLAGASIEVEYISAPRLAMIGGGSADRHRFGDVPAFQRDLRWRRSPTKLS